MKATFRHLIGLSLAVAAAACGDSFTGDLGDATGSYTATQFTTTENGVATNQLTAGGAITFDLQPAGTTTGHLVVPASASSPALNADLAGTWMQISDTVRLVHSADTFLRDMPLMYVGNKLVGDKVFGSTDVHVELTRTGTAQ